MYHLAVISIADELGIFTCININNTGLSIEEIANKLNLNNHVFLRVNSRTLPDGLVNGFFVISFHLSSFFFAKINNPYVRLAFIITSCSFLFEGHDANKNKHQKND